MIYKQVDNCRFDNSPLTTVLNLGNQALTGVFAKSKDDVIETGPLELAFSEKSCLLQLKHTFQPEKMYGDNYGYRSSLNKSMLNHLQKKINIFTKFIPLNENDVVLDIGSNDCSLLKFYPDNLKKIGIDPTGNKFKSFYPKNVCLVSDFFNKESFFSVSDKKAKIITSIAMFYDLDDINTFVSDVYQCLDDNGIWHLEQSYMPSMIRMNSYDTICHEHIEYYSLIAIKNILDKHDMDIVDVSTNYVNGGSFAITAVKKSNKIKRNKSIIDWMIEKEYIDSYHTIHPYLSFNEKIIQHKKDFLSLINRLKNDGKTIYGYGASTKGNVFLQYCNLTSDHITAIAEVNEDKFNCYTPGTYIPIISEKEAKRMNPDYFLVLPWHFREAIIAREQEYITSGGKFIFAYPNTEIV